MHSLEERLDRVVTQLETRKEPAVFNLPPATATNESVASVPPNAGNHRARGKLAVEKNDLGAVHVYASLDSEELDSMHVFAPTHPTKNDERSPTIGEAKTRAAWQDNCQSRLPSENCAKTRTVPHQQSIRVPPPRRQGQTVKAMEEKELETKVRKRKSNFLTTDKREKANEGLSRLQVFIQSSMFEAFSGLLIISNIVYVAVECEIRAERYEMWADKGEQIIEKDGPAIMVIEAIYLTLFACELGVRIAAENRSFFDWRGKDFTWNVLDTFIVSLDLVVFILELSVTASTSVSSFSLARVLRVLRVARVSKVIRVMKLFTELRILMYSIFSCIRSMIWVLVILILALLLFSILFTSATTSLLHTSELRLAKEHRDLRLYFGTVIRSTLSLYQSMTGGNDWDVFYSSLGPLDAIYRIIYLVYITFVLFALANVITGVFVENAKASGKKDREIVIQEEMALKKRYLKDMKTIFEEIDFDSTGKISWGEFQHTLNDPRVIAYFSAMRLDVTDLHHLFRLLDADNSGEIGYTEFVEGCWTLQGAATSLDTKILRLEFDSLRRAVKEGFLNQGEEVPFAIKNGLFDDEEPNSAAGFL